MHLLWLHHFLGVGRVNPNHPTPDGLQPGAGGSLARALARVELGIWRETELHGTGILGSGFPEGSRHRQLLPPSCQCQPLCFGGLLERGGLLCVGRWLQTSPTLWGMESRLCLGAWGGDLSCQLPQFPLCGGWSSGGKSLGVRGLKSGTGGNTVQPPSARQAWPSLLATESKTQMQTSPAGVLLSLSVVLHL